MKNLVASFMLGSAFLAFPAFAVGETGSTADSQSQMQASSEKNIQAEISSLQKVLAKMPKVSGYVQTGYMWQDKNMGDKQSTFQLKRMRLMLDGKISDVFDYKVQFECFSSSKDGRNKALVTVMDMFVNAHVSTALNFRLGQFYMPLGFENYFISPATLETVDFSNICYRMVCRNPITDKSYIDYGRDLGVMAYGEFLPAADKGFNYLGYYLSLTNGALPNRGDENRAKDFAGSFTVRPIKNLLLLGSYNYGEYAGNDKNNIARKNIPMNRYFGGAWYNDPTGLDLRAEYARIKSSNGNIKETGFYALAAYHLGKFLPVFRFDMYRDSKDDVSPQNKNCYLFGLTYQPLPQVKFQANYTHTTFEKDVINAGVRDGAGNLVQIMCLLKF